MYGDRIFDASNSREAHLLLSVIIAAIVHDFNHPGLTNKYQVETDSEMSREFNEQMVLENVSLRRSLMMMRQEEFDFAPEMSHKAKQLLSSNVINLVSGAIFALFGGGSTEHSWRV